MRGRLLGIVSCVAVLIVWGCDTRKEAQPASSRPRPATAAWPQGCRPQELAQRLNALFQAAGRGRVGEGLEYIESGAGLSTVAVYYGIGASAARADPDTPKAIYEALSKAVGAPSEPRLLAAAVGSNAPESIERAGANRGNPTAGVEFVVASGERSISGKVGFDCRTGRVYVGALNARKGLERQQLCGAYIRLDARRPEICGYDY